MINVEYRSIEDSLAVGMSCQSHKHWDHHKPGKVRSHGWGLQDCWNLHLKKRKIMRIEHNRNLLHLHNTSHTSTTELLVNSFTVGQITHFLSRKRVQKYHKPYFSKGLSWLLLTIVMIQQRVGHVGHITFRRGIILTHHKCLWKTKQTIMIKKLHRAFLFMPNK